MRAAATLGGALAAVLIAATTAYAAPVPGETGKPSPTVTRQAPPFGLPPGPVTDEPRDEGDMGDPPTAASDPNAPLPKVDYRAEDLPPPVRAMREALMTAARTGDPEALRPLIDGAKTPPRLSGIEGGDPIEILKSASGDEAGREVLAILLDVLDAGWVKRTDGPAGERYVWPYFAEFPPDRLDARQMVEVYRVLTAGDFEEMKAAGAYTFYRVEIAADGRWLAFTSEE